MLSEFCAIFQNKRYFERLIAQILNLEVNLKVSREDLNKKK